MRIRTIRHFILFFAVGLSWGFMAKTFASTYLYIGYDDPQVVESAGAYTIERLLDIQENVSGDSAQEDRPSTSPEADAQGADQDASDPRGTISI